MPNPNPAVLSEPSPAAVPPVAGLLARALEEHHLFEAWERVRDNDGAAGVDGQSIEAFGRHLFGQLQQLKSEVEHGRYAPQPLLAVEIPKRHGGTRTLAIPAVRDRVLQTAVARQMGALLDPGFDAASFGYRPGRSVAQAIARVAACRDAGLQQVVDADIESFFDRIDHARLLQALRERLPDEGLCALVSLWLGAVRREGRNATLQVRGVPQGSPLSPLLANLYLDGFDRRMHEAGLELVRYADDFVVLCADVHAAAQALRLVRETLAGLRLDLNERKTRLTSFEQGFDFLGVHFVHNLAEPINPQATPWLLPGERLRVLPPQEPPAAAALPQAPTAPTASEPSAARLLVSLDPALEADEVDHEGRAGDEAGAVFTREHRSPLLQTLYVGEPGCWLTREHDRVVVSRRHEVRASIPLGQLDQIAVMENAMVSTSLLRHCAERRVSVAFGGSGGELLTLDRGTLAERRLLQAQWAAQGHGELNLLLARRFVEGKLHNSRTVLRRFTRREGREAVEPLLQAIEQAQQRLATATTLDQVRGLEGAAARAYFQALKALLPEGIHFPGRQRRPPRDPVNVTLSFGYAVLAHNLHTLVRLEGLNAHLGHLHAAAAGSLALVSDLMEEFRAPLVDAVALALWRAGQLKDADFEWSTAPDEQPCRLARTARKLFVDALEAKLESRILHPGLQRLMDFRRAMQAQVRHYQRVLLREEAVYQPLKLR
ncbi:CRISPR-associated endonuclease Cas1 [Caldimonas tepidiphila]|uniref:CRISPR-associated endonuclease Cas1 n=1 Tax=Caldimonas tepidiphila TaxID=2315841 RepID=UPI000E5B64AA|nr:CRISPR-associated endonuclease Cas1 [Caldimonas tepidiphila]